MNIAIASFALSALALPALAQSEAPKPQDAKPAAADATFSAEQLEQIVAPIALHPDSLLSQILMASTYPLEIVQAYRWVQKNPSLKEKALEEALKQQSWDPAVKGLCGLPTVLKQMNDNLDWTQDLGDAFLGQKEELMKTVQKMRKKALDAGNLKSGEQQKVSQDGEIIIVESAKTEIVYVPTYYPTAVYGSWYYPSYYYPPMYQPYPAGGLMFGFAVGVAWGGCWGGCNWHGNTVVINNNNFNNFNNNTNINAKQTNINNASGNQGSWNHNPEHRQGANYKNPQTAQKYGASQGSNRVSQDQARGYDRSGSKSTPAAGGAQQRPAPANTGAGARPSSGAGAGSGARSSTGGSSGALSGSRSPSADRSASSRGAASRGGGGGGRSGGGGRR